jgi:hypothetical protein
MATNGTYAVSGYSVNASVVPSYYHYGYSYAGITASPYDYTTGSKVSLVAGIPDGTSNTVLLAERYGNCNTSPNYWGYYGYAAFTSAYTIQAAPLMTACNPSQVQASRSEGICVAMCDGTARLVPTTISTAQWVGGCNPSDGVNLPLDF